MAATHVSERLEAPSSCFQQSSIALSAGNRWQEGVEPAAIDTTEDRRSGQNLPLSDRRADITLWEDGRAPQTGESF